MPPRKKMFILPEGYTWTKFGKPMHEAGWQKAESLMEEATKRDPDAHGMYIYNDYLGYAILDLVQSVLNSVYWKSSKKCTTEQWLECWNQLAGLSVFIPQFPDFMNVDDGDLVLATDAVYGALVVKVLKAMAPEFAEKGEAGFPDLEYNLRAIANVGETTRGFDGGEYTHIIKSYARHLFGQRSEEEHQAHTERIKEAYQKFYNKLPKDQKEQYLDTSVMRTESEGDDEDEDMEEEEAESGVPWFGQWKAQDANYKIQNFPLNTVWKKYKALKEDAGATSPVQNMIGGNPVWDLTKWPADAKKEYSFDNCSD